MGRTTMMVLVAATLTGCYAPGPTVTSPTGPVTRQELRGAGEPMLGPALGALRPAWVRGGRYRTPGAPRGEAPVVYIDGQPPQEMGVLQSIPVADVERVIYLGPRDATTRYGIGHAGGAIIVQTRIGAG